RPPAPPSSRKPEMASVAPEELEPSLDDLLPAEDEEDLAAFASPVDAEEAAAFESFAPDALEAPEAQADAASADAETAGEYNLDRLQDAIKAYRVVFDTLQQDNLDAIESLERCYS